MSDSYTALKTPPAGFSASSASTTSTETMLSQSTAAPATTGKPTKMKYRPLQQISRHETLRYYRPGGYHPILIGDRLGESGRFSVLRKLGYGTYGTVWMCWDAKVMKLRAVKVMQAETSAEDYKNEVGLLALLSKNDDVVGVEEAYNNHLAAPLEHFWQDGPNGRHMCIVMPVLGPNVMKAKALGDVNYLKDVCSQVISGLAFLHSKGMAHGDLHPGNVLLQTTLSDLEVDDITPLLKQFNHEPLYAEGHDGPGPHAPKYIYENFYWAEVDPKYFKKEIAIIDFGTSFETSDPPDYPTIDMSLRAPEQFFGSSPSQASDLWALGCTMMHILGSNNPFSRHPVPSWEDALGPLPQPYRAKWIASKGAAGSRKRKYAEMEESEPVSLSSEQLAETKKCRLEESGTEDVILAFLAKPSTILVPINAQPKQQQQQQQDEAERSDGSGSGSDNESQRSTEEFKEWCLPREELDSAVSLVRSVFKYHPLDRTPAKDLLAHPFLTKHPSAPPPLPPSESQDHSPERTSPAARAAGTP